MEPMPPMTFIAVVAVPIKEVAVTTPDTNTSPTTCSFDVGLVIPIPKFPLT